jgi:hypothetical protein
MDQPYPLGINDAAPLIDKLRASGAQAAFPLSYLNDSLFIVRSMRQQHVSIPVIGGAAGYIIPDFEKGLGEFAEDVLSIAPTNYDLAPALTDNFRKRFGFGKPEGSDGGPARWALRRWLDQSNAWRRSLIRPVRIQYAFDAYHGPMAQQGIGDGLAERLC